MLPGDYIAMKLTGKVQTTISGLSEGILWDFREQGLAHSLLEHYGFDAELIPEVVADVCRSGHRHRRRSRTTRPPARSEGSLPGR